MDLRFLLSTGFSLDICIISRTCFFAENRL